MVEGAHLRAGRNDIPENAVHVLEHVPSGNPHDVKAFTPEQRIASHITLRLVAKAVPLSIHFDDEAPLKAGEVDSELSDRKLLPEFQAHRSLTKLLPQQHFREAHLTPQFTGALH